MTFRAQEHRQKQGSIFSALMQLDSFLLLCYSLFAIMFWWLGDLHYERKEGTQSQIPKADSCGGDWSVCDLAYVSLKMRNGSAGLLSKNTQNGSAVTNQYKILALMWR